MGKFRSHLVGVGRVLLPVPQLDSFPRFLANIEWVIIGPDVNPNSNLNPVNQILEDGFEFGQEVFPIIKATNTLMAFQVDVGESSHRYGKNWEGRLGATIPNDKIRWKFCPREVVGEINDDIANCIPGLCDLMLTTGFCQFPALFEDAEEGTDVVETIWSYAFFVINSLREPLRLSFSKVPLRPLTDLVDQLLKPFRRIHLDISLS